MRSAWQEMADMFEAAGARVVDVSLPHTQYSIVTYILTGVPFTRIISGSEVSLAGNGRHV